MGIAKAFCGIRISSRLGNRLTNAIFEVGWDIYPESSARAAVKASHKGCTIPFVLTVFYVLIIYSAEPKK